MNSLSDGYYVSPAASGATLWRRADQTWYCAGLWSDGAAQWVLADAPSAPLIRIAEIPFAQAPQRRALDPKRIK